MMEFKRQVRGLGEAALILYIHVIKAYYTHIYCKSYVYVYSTYILKY